jgi:hypothetical protein
LWIVPSWKRKIQLKVLKFFLSKCFSAIQ